MIETLWDLHWHIAWALMPWLFWLGIVMGSVAGFLYSWGQRERVFKLIVRSFIGGCIGVAFGIYSALMWLPNTIFVWTQLAQRIAVRKAKENASE